MISRAFSYIQGKRPSKNPVPLLQAAVFGQKIKDKTKP